MQAARPARGAVSNTGRCRCYLCEKFALGKEHVPGLVLDEVQGLADGLEDVGQGVGCGGTARGRVGLRGKPEKVSQIHVSWGGGCRVWIMAVLHHHDMPQ